jgi:outer membrane receptor protein involved in Fe transport
MSYSPGTVSMTGDRAGSRESILRAVYRRQDGDVSLNAGVEGTINILNSRNSLFTNGAPVALPAANVRVAEKRGEGFVAGTWRATPTLTAELEMRYESSVLSQSGDTNLSKPLSFAKPRLQASWRPFPGNEFRFSVERQVGQLDFDDFVSSANLLNDNVEAGNRDLEPDRTTRFELTWERHFWTRGSLTVTAQREDVTQLIDHVPVFNDDGTVYDANGNIGDGQRDRLVANLTMPLDELCLTGFTVQAAGNLTQSDVIDPATGQSRAFSGDHPFDGWISLTKDMPRRRLRWGMTLASPSVDQSYRANEFRRDQYPARLSAFVEYRPRPQWTVRLFGERMTQIPTYRDRTIYDGLRGSSDIAYVEERALNTGMMLGINIQHTFQD